MPTLYIANLTADEFHQLLLKVLAECGALPLSEIVAEASARMEQLNVPGQRLADYLDALEDLTKRGALVRHTVHRGRRIYPVWHLPVGIPAPSSR